MVAPLFVVVLLTVAAWRVYGPRTGFLHAFAKLLDHPEVVEGFANWFIGRSFLKGEFRGRKVVILLQRGHGRYPQMLVVSMETYGTSTMDSYEFVGDRFDKESELAVFALEVKHGLKLKHEDACLKARWGRESWPSLFIFPGRFDPPKWQNVLEAMRTVAGSLERRTIA
jgi:hypothetical protein